LARWLVSQQVLGDAVVCDSDALRALIAESGANAVIQPNPRRKKTCPFDPVT
jgi:hypothetical protein